MLSDERTRLDDRENGRICGIFLGECSPPLKFARTSCRVFPEAALSRNRRRVPARCKYHRVGFRNVATEFILQCDQKFDSLHGVESQIEFQIMIRRNISDGGQTSRMSLMTPIACRTFACSSHLIFLRKWFLERQAASDVQLVF